MSNRRREDHWGHTNAFDKDGQIKPDAGGAEGQDYQEYRKNLRDKASANVWGDSESEGEIASNHSNDKKREDKKDRSLPVRDVPRTTEAIDVDEDRTPATKDLKKSWSPSSSSSSTSSRDSKHKSKKRKSAKSKSSKRHKSSKQKKEKDAPATEPDLPSPAALDMTATWVEKQVTNQLSDSSDEHGSAEEETFGPAPKSEKSSSRLVVRGFDANMRPGEADAIAQFVQSGQRIPRRGEVGLTSDEIETYEKMGYVMSGSRHRRMNAVRIRKENQIYSAEEKRALMMYNYEEKMARESEILQGFKNLVSRKFAS